MPSGQAEGQADEGGGAGDAGLVRISMMIIDDIC
jgi:hypothetical protein